MTNSRRFTRELTYGMLRRRSWLDAEAPDLEPCAAHGDTPEKAVAELRVAMQAWLDVARENDLPIPEPRFRPTTVAAE